MNKTKKRPLKIAQLAPLAERVPPKKYGGTERVIAALTKGLVKKGHKVTLFATGDSKTPAKLVSVYPRSIREANISDPYGTNELTLLNIGACYSRQSEFDIIHDHLGTISLPTANLANIPVVSSMHGPFIALKKRLFESLRNPYVVTISKSQRDSAPDLNHIATIHHGLEMANYPFSPKHGGYLLFVGRISMEKGVHFAIETAQYLDLPLIIAAKLEKVDEPYFKQYVEPKLTNQTRIKWIGEVDEKTRNRLMSRALCFLHPVTWREPFGLVMIEAMACGCPVVGFNRGSVGELVENGKTGYVVDYVGDMIAGVSEIKKIKRADCRKYALEKFSAERMVNDYENVYYEIMEGRNFREQQGKSRASAKDA